MNNQITGAGHVGQKSQAGSFGNTGNKGGKFSDAVKELLLKHGRRKGTSLA
jgi:hypothetical protein